MLSEFYQVRVSAKQQFPVTRAALTRKTHMHICKERQFRRLHNEKVVGYWYQWDRYGGLRACHAFSSNLLYVLSVSQLTRLVSRHQHTCVYVCTHAYISKYSLSPTSDLSCGSRLRAGRSNYSQKGVITFYHLELLSNLSYKYSKGKLLSFMSGQRLSLLSSSIVIPSNVKMS